MNIDISVIIPLYKGTKYLYKIFEQMSVAQDNFNGCLELILVNDDPDSKIEIPQRDLNFEINILETTKNTGIQAARIRGLSVARGCYIHFLDQDDEIFPDFYETQMESINDSDAVYCRCYNGNRQTYNYNRFFETAFNKENILAVCPVISPGQVLIRKSSIPDFWKTNILFNIGSDDYMLWLCMYAQGCKFSLNQRILYRHVRNGYNFSSDVLRHSKSDEEMVKILMDSNMFSDEDCTELAMLPERQIKRKYLPQRKDQIVLQVLSDLLSCYEKGNSLESFLDKRGINKIAIYGAAVLGERIKGLLKGTKVSVECFIDKNAPFIEEDIPVIKLEECEITCDAILISLIENEESVEDYIRSSKNTKIYKIREIVEYMMNE